jgi:hypothetical protein
MKVKNNSTQDLNDSLIERTKNIGSYLQLPEVETMSSTCQRSYHFGISTGLVPNRFS